VPSPSRRSLAQFYWHPVGPFGKLCILTPASLETPSFGRDVIFSERAPLTNFQSRFPAWQIVLKISLFYSISLFFGFFFLFSPLRSLFFFVGLPHIVQRALSTRTSPSSPFLEACGRPVVYFSAWPILAARKMRHPIMLVYPSSFYSTGWAGCWPLMRFFPAAIGFWGFWGSFSSVPLTRTHSLRGLFFYGLVMRSLSPRSCAFSHQLFSPSYSPMLFPYRPPPFFSPILYPEGPESDLSISARVVCDR